MRQFYHSVFLGVFLASVFWLPSFKYLNKHFTFTNTDDKAHTGIKWYMYVYIFSCILQKLLLWLFSLKSCTCHLFHYPSDSIWFYIFKSLISLMYNLNKEKRQPRLKRIRNVKTSPDLTIYIAPRSRSSVANRDLVHQHIYKSQSRPYILGEKITVIQSPNCCPPEL